MLLMIARSSLSGSTKGTSGLSQNGHPSIRSGWMHDEHMERMQSSFTQISVHASATENRSRQSAGLEGVIAQPGAAY